MEAHCARVAKPYLSLLQVKSSSNLGKRSRSASEEMALEMEGKVS